MEEMPSVTQVLLWVIFGAAGLLLLRWLLRWLWRLGKKL
jgi:hypothetical protein